VPWPGGNAARGGGGATRLSSRSLSSWVAVGGASTGFNATTGVVALTLEILMNELPAMNRADLGRRADKEVMNRSIQLEAIDMHQSGW
jgi:hypothetical protein